MIYTLYRADGEERNLTRDLWHGALKAAKAAGWCPAGTVLDGDSGWCGSYKGCSGQYITPEDAAAFCAELAGTAFEHVGIFIDSKKTWIF